MCVIRSSLSCRCVFWEALGVEEYSLPDMLLADKVLGCDMHFDKLSFNFDKEKL